MEVPSFVVPSLDIGTQGPDANLISQMVGFDPLELLETVEFPNDRYERLLRVSKVARMMAIRHQEIPLSEEFTSGSITEFVPSVSTAAFFKVTSPDPSRPTSANSHHNLLAANAQQDFHRSAAFLDPGLSHTRALSQSRSLGSAIGLNTPSRAPSAHQETRKEREALKRERRALKDQLARSAAALAIQSLYRGWLTRRKYVSVRYAKLTVNATGSSHDLGETAVTVLNLPSVDDLRLQERMIAKYNNFCRKVQFIEDQIPTYPYFCALKIQSIFRMFTVRSAFVHLRRLARIKGDKEAADRADEARNAIRRRAERGDLTTTRRYKAAEIIQRAWRSFYAVRIYRFYRDLIRFRERGDPQKLLRYVNPKEAKLIDQASNIHVRFRLGGTSFPPTIYYKIFVHQNLVDMNAFSPRNYTLQSSKQPLPKMLFSKGAKLPNSPSNGGWYTRVENNGWRPVSDAVHSPNQTEAVQTTLKPTSKFHHLKLKRRAEVERQKRMRRLEWLQKIYIEGKQKAELNLHLPHTPHAAPAVSFLLGNPLHQGNITIADSSVKVLPGTEDVRPPQTEEELLEAIAELEQELDHELMLKWSLALDFDSYKDNWLSLSTTGRSNDPNTFDFVNMVEPQLTFANTLDLEQLNIKALDTQVQPALPSLPNDGLMSPEKPQRPWSGRSGQSMGDIFLTSQS